MAFIPARVKYRKHQKGDMRGISVSGCRVNFGEFGLKAMECGLLTNNQLEMVRVFFARALRRSGKAWIRVFADKPITKKPQEVRMGKGKGDVDHWAAVITRGRVVFEMGGVPREYALQLFKKISYKLPFKVKLVER
jgi:large subunit ribosomal protein L16